MKKTLLYLLISPFLVNPLWAADSDCPLRIEEEIKRRSIENKITQIEKGCDITTVQQARDLMPQLGDDLQLLRLLNKIILGRRLATLEMPEVSEEWEKMAQSMESLIVGLRKKLNASLRKKPKESVSK